MNSYTVAFGSSNWTLLIDGYPYLVRYTEQPSDAVLRALGREFLAVSTPSHEWRVVRLRSSLPQNFDTFVYVYVPSGARDAAPALVVDASLVSISATRLASAMQIDS